MEFSPVVPNEKDRLRFHVDTPLDEGKIAGKGVGGLLMHYPRAIFDRVFRQDRLDELIVYFVKWSAIFAAISGAVLGFHSVNLQIVSGAIKTPLLLMGTMGICLPALFTFNVLLGSQLTLKQTAAVLTMATYMLCTVLLSLSPILLFFLLTTQSYNFVIVLTVAAFGTSGVFGVLLLWNAMGYLTVRSGYPYDWKIIKTWTLIYAFVGTQFAWVLRPFVGDGTGFVWLRLEHSNFESNFYVSVAKTLMTLFGGHAGN